MTEHKPQREPRWAAGGNADQTSWPKGESNQHNIHLGGGTGPERLGGDTASGQPKTLVGAPPAETPRSAPSVVWPAESVHVPCAQHGDRNSPVVCATCLDRLIEQYELVKTQRDGYILKSDQLEEQYELVKTQRDGYILKSDQLEEQLEAAHELLRATIYQVPGSSKPPVWWADDAIALLEGSNPAKERS